MRVDRLTHRAHGRIHALQELVRNERARRRELRRFREAGRSVAAERGETEHLAALAEECARSRRADRADCAEVLAWMRPMVVVRGLAARAVLRHRIARGHRELAARYEALGRAAASGAAAAAYDPSPPGPGASWAGRPDSEAARFARAFWAQVRPAILPKAPALAGLAVGWWIANTYTDSRWKSLARSIGIGSGGTHVVSSETYRAMRFWLPLVAAAVCAYLGDRIAAALRERITAPPYTGTSSPAQGPESP
jgi:hypothetical protein